MDQNKNLPLLTVYILKQSPCPALYHQEAKQPEKNHIKGSNGQGKFLRMQIWWPWRAKDIVPTEKGLQRSFLEMLKRIMCPLEMLDMELVPSLDGIWGVSFGKGMSVGREEHGKLVSSTLGHAGIAVYSLKLISFPPRCTEYTSPNPLEFSVATRLDCC